MDKNTFIQQCAIEAMQGIQESGKIGIALDIVPAELAKLSFDIAESMWSEYEKRYGGIKYDKRRRNKTKSKRDF